MDNKELLKEEKKILAEEKQILKKEENILKKIRHNVWIMSGLIGLVVVLTLGGIWYWQVYQSRVYVEKAQISATHISLASTHAGALEEIFVKEGDVVLANTPVARVGNELVKTKVAGLIISANDNLGKLFGAGESVVTMIQSSDLRVVGRVGEDKGLRYLNVGQRAEFVVDAFSGRTYYGTVDEISPASRDSGVVFNISDKREVKEFDVKVRFNADTYPELKDGMSAKIYIYKN
ncbi:MAG: HlyD family secretion protein [Candidatus Buchananbacteria bacterium]